MGHAWEVQGSGLALEPLEPWLAAAGVIRLQALVDVWLATCASAVDQTGAGVGHGRDGFGGAQAGV